ncbi:MAG: sugar phosphate isomerase/epimerase family protein [Bryobacteraceae bacterium]
MTRRTLVSSLAFAAALRPKPGDAAPRRQFKEWNPRLGVLGKYTPANVEWAHAQGFTNMILGPDRRTVLQPQSITDEQIQEMRSVLDKNHMHVSALQVSGNHIDPDPEKRAKMNAYIVKVIETCGKLGVPYIGTQSGKDPSKPFLQQVDEVKRVYTEKYFPACEKNHVRILWEPYPEAPNLATSPVGFSALFKAFGDSPYVGLQYDPSHLVRQFMEPIECEREFVDKIYDVHLKDTQIMWDILHAGGIKPVNHAHWWRYRIPGMGQIVWRDFFSVLQNVGYSGSMSIEHEDPLYGDRDNPGPDFSDVYREGFVMAKRYLNQYVPPHV